MNVVPLMGKQFGHYISNNELYEVELEQKLLLEKITDFLERPPVTITKKTFSGSKDEVNATVKMLLEKLETKIYDIEDEFEDVHARIYNFGVVLKILNEIIENLDETKINEKYLMRTSIIVHDVIKKVKSENFDRTQLDVIKQGLLCIIKGKVSKEEFNQMDNKLLDCGLDWIYGG